MNEPQDANSTEKYTISEMSRLLGVTTHMLRHYEKMGIIRPEVNQENGYRYYCVVDTRRFNLSRSLLACGFSLEQCAQILEEKENSELPSLIRQKMEEKEREILKARLAIRYLKKVEEAYADWTERVGQVWVETFPPMWRLNLSRKEHAVVSKDLEEQREAWLSFLPGVFWVSRIRKEEIRIFGHGIIGYEYGLMCYEKDALEMGLKKTRDVEMIPGGDYLTGIHIKTGRGPYTWENISALTDYLQREKISSFGDCFSYIVASRNENGKHINYHKMFLKIYS